MYLFSYTVSRQMHPSLPLHMTKFLLSITRLVNSINPSPPPPPPLPPTSSANRQCLFRKFAVLCVCFRSSTPSHFIFLILYTTCYDTIDCDLIRTKRLIKSFCKYHTQPYYHLQVSPMNNIDPANAGCMRIVRGTNLLDIH